MGDPFIIRQQEDIRRGRMRCRRTCPDRAAIVGKSYSQMEGDREANIS